jgi:serine phosphatase RsbU (regulator of sigma subunit)
MDELWGEMELARKIQTVLLPKHPKITGYDIVGSMTPATEVGGDYYDVINVDNYNWLIIGDVSGHGVTAGLVMMMVQTAIHTTLRQHPQIPPKDLLIAINNVIAGNIKLLGESKYMTLTVIACLEDGVFNFSGLHLDLMLYRAGSKTIEVIETNGIWIGIVPDIDGMNHDYSFRMDKGDVLCLYTDGFTEAVLKTTGALFSEEKLNDILLGLCQSGKTAKEVQEGVLAELKQYQIRDDVTMVIMKRL